jgi:hypothetical protein
MENRARSLMGRNDSKVQQCGDEPSEYVYACMCECRDSLGRRLLGLRVRGSAPAQNNLCAMHVRPPHARGRIIATARRGRVEWLTEERRHTRADGSEPIERSAMQTHIERTQ